VTLVQATIMYLFLLFLPQGTATLPNGLPPDFLLLQTLPSASCPGNPIRPIGVVLLCAQPAYPRPSGTGVE
jgi:hypothetical protein